MNQKKNRGREYSNHTKKRKGRSYRTPNIEYAEYMGIDWGKSDIGIALSNGDSKMAFAYTTISNEPGAVEKIGKSIREKGVKTVIIGIPSSVNRFEVLYDGEKLGELLESNYGVTVHYQNEMFSTKLAERNLIAQGIRGIERYDDQEAARIILQDWLDRKTLDTIDE